MAIDLVSPTTANFVVTVGQPVADAEETADGGHVDDHTGLARQHPADEGLRDVEDAADVHGVEAVHVVGGRGDRRPDVADAGVVDEDVERAVPSFDIRRHLRARRVAGHVERAEVRGAAGGADGLGHPGSIRFVAIRDVHGGAGARQRTGDGFANP